MADSVFDKVYNPDVLSCLANLSNDEVFTPPEIVNQMLDLLPQELFKNPDTKFLDPACKTGVFLREIAKRLIKGLEQQFPDLQQRIDHIFHNQLYGIAITELTSLLSRRGLYCSKYPNSEFSVSLFDTAEGNIRYKKVSHTWKDGRCIYCGASQKEYDRDQELETHAYEFIHTLMPEEIFKMKFDVIISNPPYQLSDGGGTGSSAMPIYQYFVQCAKKLKPRYISMIIPSRWFAGGKGLDDFRTDMLNDPHIVKMVDFANSADCFPGVIIAGGVNYFLWDKDYTGDCTIVNKKHDYEVSSVRKLNEFNIFVRDNIAINIIRKVRNKASSYFDSSVYPRNYFGLISSEAGRTEKLNDDLSMLSLNGFSFISKNKINDKDGIVSKYKVIMTKAMSGGNKPSSDGDYQVVSSIRILKPYEVCTETYLIIKAFDDYDHAKNLCIYMKSKFFRFLLLQALTSINISKDKFCFIPIQDFSKPWTDEELYAKYNLTQEEIDFIESMIKPME